MSTGRLARGAAASTVGGVVTALAGFATVAAVARVLGPSGAGVLGVAVAVAAILGQVAKLGCDTALVHTLPRWGADPAVRPHRRRLLTACLASTATVSVLLAAVVWWAAPMAADLLLSSSSDRETAHALRAVAVGLPPAAATAVALAGTRGLGSVRALVTNDQLAKPLLRLGATAVVLGLGGSVVDVLLVWSLVSWALLPAALRALHLALGPSGVAAGPVPDLTPFIRFSVLRLSSASVEVLGQHAGLLLVAALLGAADAGRYTVALRLVLAGYLTLQAVRLAIAPHLSTALATHDPREAERLHQVATAWVVLSAWPGYLVLIGIGGPVLGAFGPGFAGAGTTLAILAVGGLVAVGAGNIQTVLLMGGRADSYLLASIVSAGTHVSALLVLVPVAGLEGAGAAFLLTSIVENMLVAGLARRQLSVRAVGPPVLAAAAASVLTVGAGAGVLHLLDRTGSLHATTAGAVLLAAVAALVVGCWSLRSWWALPPEVSRSSPPSIVPVRTQEST